MPYDYVHAFTEGHSYNELVASYLQEYGVRCTVPELRIASSLAERRHLTVTEKDILLDDTGHVLEVKSSRRSFGWDPLDFPYPDTIVDTVNSYESKKVKPCAYILYSRPTGAMVAIGTSTKPRWKKTKFFDRYQQITDEFYLVGKDDIKPIGDLIQYLKNAQNRQR